MSEGELRLTYMAPVTLTAESRWLLAVRDDQGGQAIRWSSADRPGPICWLVTGQHPWLPDRQSSFDQASAEFGACYGRAFGYLPVDSNVRIECVKSRADLPLNLNRRT